MAKNKVVITGINTSTLKILKKDEMNELFRQYKTGDKSVKSKLVECNLRLVLSILRKYQNKCDNMDDLFQIGTIGLIKAIDNFDLSFGVMFSTYAVFMIEGEIKRYLRDNSHVRISRSIKELAYSIVNYKEEMINKNSISPTNEEICEHFDISDYQLSLALSSLREPMSIFDPIYNDGGDTIYLVDQIEDKSVEDLNQLLSLREALNKIKEREKDVLMKRYMHGLSQSEIANEMDISQAQVSRIEASALSNVKKLIL